MSSAGFAAAVAAAPALAMLLGSALLMRWEVSARIQAVFQVRQRQRQYT